MILMTLLCLLQEPSITDLIRSLDDDEIAVRRRAAEEIHRRGRSAEEALWVALIRGESLEVRLTAQELLERAGAIPRPQEKMPLERLYTVTDSVRIFGKLKDDPPQIDR